MWKSEARSTKSETSSETEKKKYQNGGTADHAGRRFGIPSSRFRHCFGFRASRAAGLSPCHPLLLSPFHLPVTVPPVAGKRFGRRTMPVEKWSDTVVVVHL